MARISRRALPFLPLMRDAEAQVQRLVELHADDAATKAGDPGSLATALVVLATAASAPGSASADAADPASVLAVAGPVPVPAVARPVPVLTVAGSVPVLAAVTGPVSPLAAVAGPGPVLASAAADAVARIHRLLRPAEPLGRPRRLLLRAMAAGFVLGPLVMALAPAVLALALGRVPHP